MSTETKTEGTPYLLSALMALINTGKIMREYVKARSQRYLNATLDYMVEPEGRQYISVVDSDHPKVVEKFGEGIKKSRTRVFLITDPVAIAPFITHPSEWLGVLPIVGRKAAGDNVNDGTHRLGSIDYGVEDFIGWGVDLGIKREEIEVSVTLNEGNLADHGTKANFTTEGPANRDHLDTVWDKFDEQPEERRSHHAVDHPPKIVQHGFGIYKVHEPELVAFPGEARVYDTNQAKKVVYKAGDFMEKANGQWPMLGNVPGLNAIGVLLRGLFRASLEFMRTPPADIPEAILKAHPFKGTYEKIGELVNCAVVDAYTAYTDKAIRDRKAVNRPFFQAAWQRFLKDGWDLQTKSGNKKPVKNPVAAEAVKLLVAGGTEEEQAVGGMIADMLESGSVNAAMRTIIQDAARKPLTSEDFTEALDKTFPPKSKAKIENKAANELAKAAIANCLGA